MTHQTRTGDRAVFGTGRQDNATLLLFQMVHFKSFLLDQTQKVAGDDVGSVLVFDMAVLQSLLFSCFETS